MVAAHRATARHRRFRFWTAKVQPDNPLADCHCRAGWLIREEGLGGSDLVRAAIFMGGDFHPRQTWPPRPPIAVNFVQGERHPWQRWPLPGQTAAIFMGGDFHPRQTWPPRPPIAVNFVQGERHPWQRWPLPGQTAAIFMGGDFHPRQTWPLILVSLPSRVLAPPPDSVAGNNHG